MVLNHASIHAPDRHTAVEWLKDVTKGMAMVVRDGVAQAALRVRQPLNDTSCLADASLFDVCQTLRQEGARDEYLFFIRLSEKVPLLVDLGEDLSARFHSCEARFLPLEDGEPLVLCAIADWIAIGFPSDPIWDSDQITVRFDELVPDESIGEAAETIDNLTRSAHARPICERYRADLRHLTDAKALWQARAKAFPNLVFGPEVEEHLLVLDVKTLSLVVKRSASLEESAREWRIMGGDAPSWKCNVTPESQRVKESKLLGDRIFPSHRSPRELFEWHARFGSGGRIHLRFDPKSHEVEIGYIGRHLPL